MKTENPNLRKQPLYSLVGCDGSLTNEEVKAINELRSYRNRWVHCNMDDLNDDAILENEEPFIREAQEMACLAIKMLLTVLFSN